MWPVMPPSSAAIIAAGPIASTFLCTVLASNFEMHHRASLASSCVRSTCLANVAAILSRIPRSGLVKRQRPRTTLERRFFSWRTLDGDPEKRVVEFAHWIENCFCRSGLRLQVASQGKEPELVGSVAAEKG